MTGRHFFRLLGCPRQLDYAVEAINVETRSKAGFIACPQRIRPIRRSAGASAEEAPACGSHGGQPRLSAKMCMAVMPPPTELLTSGKVTDATAFDASTGTVVAKTYIVIVWDEPPIELR